MPRMADIWRKVTGPFREFGAAAGALYAVDRVLRRISPRLGLYVYELMVQPITGRALLPPNLVKNITFAEIGPGHPDLALMPARDDIKALRFDQGARCLGAYRKGKLIGYSWFCFDSYAEDEVRCDYHLVEKTCSVFDFDFYVLPEHRMGIGFLAVWHGVNLFLAERGVRYTFSRLTRFNTASRRAHAHLGWRCVGRAVFLQAWRVELMVSTLAPFVRLSWPGSRRVELHLAPDVLEPAASPIPVAPAADEAVGTRSN